MDSNIVFSQVSLRTPEQLADDAMRISAALELILHLDVPNVTRNGFYCTTMKPAIELCAELANRLSNDIERLARSGGG